MLRSVAHPSARIEIRTLPVVDGAIFTVHVHPRDIEPLVAEGGRMAELIRVFIAEFGRRSGRRLCVVIEEDDLAGKPESGSQSETQVAEPAAEEDCQPLGQEQYSPTPLEISLA
jgi:predicted RNA-binding protein YlqC (UPF0109 family)